MSHAIGTPNEYDSKELLFTQRLSATLVNLLAWVGDRLANWL